MRVYLTFDGWMAYPIYRVAAHLKELNRRSARSFECTGWNIFDGCNGSLISSENSGIRGYDSEQIFPKNV